MKINKTILILLILLTSIGLNAQNLIVKLKNSAIESFPLDEINSLKFGQSSLKLYKIDGTIITFDIFDFENYFFNNTLSVDSKLNLKNSDLKLFPNPTTNLLNIQYTSKVSSLITIEILDANGKLIQQVYEGNHEGERIYKWFNEVPKGNYYCRIITDNKIISKPIIIQ